MKLTKELKKQLGEKYSFTPPVSDRDVFLLQRKPPQNFAETVVASLTVGCVKIEATLFKSKEKLKLCYDVFVKDTLALKEGCVINGNLHVRKLAVELGSTFNGNCKMINESEFEKFSGGEKKPAAPVAGVHTAPAQAQHAAPAN